MSTIDPVPFVPAAALGPPFLVAAAPPGSPPGATPGHSSVLPLAALDPLPFVLLVAGLGSGLVVSLALAAFARRRSLSYFLVTLALATLLSRSLFGALFVNGYLGPPQHHVLEHGLDVVGVLLLFGAVWAARTVDPEVNEDE